MLACGRRWGKSLLALMACLLAARRPGAQIWYVAPTFRMVDLHFRTLQRHLPAGYPGVIRRAERALRCDNGAEIGFRSANHPDHLRGVGLDFLVVDEAVFIPQGAVAWREALRPTLADRAGRALLISTPRGHDWFAALHAAGLELGQTEIASFTYPSATNPHLPPAELEAARRELPARIWAQEFEARFLDDGGGVFRGVRRAATGELREPYPGRFAVGVDWGKREDFTVFCVLDTETGAVVDLRRYRQIDYAVQTQHLADLCARWAPAVVLTERNAMGEPLLEQLVRDGLPVRGFLTTAGSKARLLDQLALAFDRDELSLPPDPVLIAELESYTLERTPAGNYRYGAPAGGHDECVIALALAWEARGQAAIGRLAEFL